MITLLLIILLILFVACIIIVIVDSNRFVIREYTIKTDKIKDPVDFLFITDLHCKEYGPDNEKLFKAIDSVKANYALVGGDIMVARKGKKQDRGIAFLKKLSNRMPVYMAYGNHEQRSKLHTNTYGNMYADFFEAVQGDNLHILDNASCCIGNVNITGYTMDEKFYIRKNRLHMTREDVIKLTGDFDDEKFNILLAHDPEYFDAYCETGTSLVLSGHFHGGIARLPFLGGVISPRFLLFPDYSAGEYEKNGVNFIVSCGLGMHSIPFRFNNPAELSLIHLKKD